MGHSGRRRSSVLLVREHDTNELEISVHGRSISAALRNVKSIDSGTRGVAGTDEIGNGLGSGLARRDVEADQRLPTTRQAPSLDYGERVSLHAAPGIDSCGSKSPVAYE